MLNDLLLELAKYEEDISKIKVNKKIDCITIFSHSEEEYEELNDNLISIGNIIDEMTSGNLYYLSNKINTKYGILEFIKVRKYDSNYDNYRISVDFVVDNYEEFKNHLDNPTIKKYDTFELIQFKSDKSIINVISLSAKTDYGIKD